MGTREGGGLTDGGFFPPGTHVRVDSRPSVRSSVPNAERRLARFLCISPSLPEAKRRRTGCWDARERESERAREGGMPGTKTRLLSPSPSTLTFDKKEARIRRLHESPLPLPPSPLTLSLSLSAVASPSMFNKLSSCSLPLSRLSACKEMRSHILERAKVVPLPFPPRHRSTGFVFPSAEYWRGRGRAAERSADSCLMQHAR